MPGSFTKAVAIGALAAAVGGGAFWYLRLERAPEAPGPAAAAAERTSPGVAVEAAEVKAGLVVDAVTVTGSLRSDEEATISAEIAGRVDGIHFKEGQTVEQGALLFTIDDAIYRADLATTEANLKLSERTFERAKELLKRKAGTAQASDEAEAELEINRAKVNQARTRLDKTRITAPFAGIVGLRRVSVGEYVTPGQDLVNLEDIDPIKVDFSVPERYLSAVKPAQPIEVTVEAWPERTFEGAVYAIDPQISTEGRSITIRARIDNQERLLRPGLFATVRLITDRRENALLIPEQAIFAQDDKQYVYKVEDGTARRVEVAIRSRRVGQAEIASGLAAGDVVVTAGQMKLHDGARVRVIDTGAPATADKGVS